jgi:hypothetical protein
MPHSIEKDTLKRRVKWSSKPNLLSRTQGWQIQRESYGCLSVQAPIWEKVSLLRSGNTSTTNKIAYNWKVPKINTYGKGPKLSNSQDKLEQNGSNLKYRAPFVLKYSQVQTLPGASPNPVKSSTAFRILDYQVRLSLMKIVRQKGSLQQLQQHLEFLSHCRKQWEDSVMMLASNQDTLLMKEVNSTSFKL